MKEFLNINNLSDSVGNDFSNATDLADYLVGKGVPFRTAYQVVGEIVKYCLEKKMFLKNLKIERDEYIFHAGTVIKDDKYLATGGRVLNVIVTTENFKNSKEKAIKILNDLDWKDGFFRKDIAYKVT